MKYNYIFFTEDCSFDYNGPFGTATQREAELHGFCIDIDTDNNININSLKGYGAFADIESCKNLIEMYQYIEDNKHYAEDYTRLELLLELQEIILQNAKSEKLDFSEFAYATPKERVA